MQGKIYEIPLDISNGVLTSQIRELVTEDMGTNTFRFKVVSDNRKPYDFTGTIVRMMVKTPLGARIQQECTIENAVGGTVSLTLKQSLLLEHGSYIAELQIFDAITQSIRLTTPTFTYHVRQSLQNSESIVATDEYTILQEALADLAGINIVVANKADKSDVGDIEDLETDYTTDLVGAINEVKTQSNDIATDLGTHKAEDVTVGGMPHGIIYETGTWIPQLRIGGSTVGITYSVQAGKYTRNGNNVIAEFEILLTSKGALAGSITIAGIPFSTNPNAPRVAFPIGEIRNVNFATQEIVSASIAVNSSTILLNYNRNELTTRSMIESDITNTSRLTATFSYNL